MLMLLSGILLPSLLMFAFVSPPPDMCLLFRQSIAFEVLASALVTSPAWSK